MNRFSEWLKFSNTEKASLLEVSILCVFILGLIVVIALLYDGYTRTGGIPCRSLICWVP